MNVLERWRRKVRRTRAAASGVARAVVLNEADAAKAAERWAIAEREREDEEDRRQVAADSAAPDRRDHQEGSRLVSADARPRQV